MTTLQTISAAVNWNLRVNENFKSVSPAACFGIKDSTTTGLTLGYYGGVLDGVSYADGTHLLTASTTRYVVVKRSDGVVSSSTGTTNWNNQTDYLRMGVAVVGTSTITTWTDWRVVYSTGTFTGGTLTSALNEAPAVALASAATVNIGAAAANTVTVSGTTTITAFDSIAASAIRRVRFLGVLTLTHNATSLILPGGASITTAAGDVATMESLGSGNWRCIGYARADGTALVGGGGGAGTVTSVDASGGVETASGSAITGSGTVRGATLVNAQTGTTYTYLTGDRGKLVTHSNASAIAGTLPQATSTFGAGWFMKVKNKGAGTLTITPTTSTVDGAATLVLTTGQSALIVSDGTNYQVAFVSSSSGAATWGSITGTLSSQTDLQAALDAKAAAGIPQNSQSTAYTAVLGDANKHLLHPSADTTARTFTIPANASVAYPIGTALTFVNQDSAGVMTIAITSDTMRLAGVGSTGNRTLAANGICTALKLTSTEWIVSGTGLT